MTTKKRFDLTNEDGFDEAVDWLGKKKYLVAGVLLLGPLAPLAVLGTLAARELATYLKDRKITAERQIAAVESLIEAGRKHDVDVLELTLDNEAGLKVKGQVFSEVDIEVFAGQKNKMELRVKYK